MDEITGKKIENEGDDLNVEEIMRSIRDKIRRDHSDLRDNHLEKSSPALPLIRSRDMDGKLSFLLNNSKIANNDYAITSHRKLISPVLITGRKLVHGEVRRYVDPITWKQNDFNENMASALNDLVNSVDNLAANMRSEMGDLGRRLGDTDSMRLDIERLISKIDELESIQSASQLKLQQQVESAKSEIRSEIVKVNDHENERVAIIFNRLNAMSEICSGTRQPNDQTSKPQDYKDTKLPFSYLAFENTFRGSEEEIKSHQNYYLQFFFDDNTLDIGCGRGEFLELLKTRGVKAMGIELDGDMYMKCAGKGLDVKKIDAIEYLTSVQDNTIGGVFMAQVIEHIEPSNVPALLQIIYNKLKLDRPLVIETVNILNVGALMNFYVDPTHIRPVHPVYLEYLLKVCGYRDIEVVYRTYNAVPEGFDKNRIKEIAPDYAIICKK